MSRAMHTLLLDATQQQRVMFGPLLLSLSRWRRHHSSEVRVRLLCAAMASLRIRCRARATRRERDDTLRFAAMWTASRNDVQRGLARLLCTGWRRRQEHEHTQASILVGVRRNLAGGLATWRSYAITSCERRATREALVAPLHSRPTVLRHAERLTTGDGTSPSTPKRFRQRREMLEQQLQQQGSLRRTPLHDSPQIALNALPTTAPRAMKTPLTVAPDVLHAPDELRSRPEVHFDVDVQRPSYLALSPIHRAA
jgi:hypothetical protein